MSEVTHVFWYTSGKRPFLLYVKYFYYAVNYALHSVLLSTPLLFMGYLAIAAPGEYLRVARVAQKDGE